MKKVIFAMFTISILMSCNKIIISRCKPEEKNPPRPLENSKCMDRKIEDFKQYCCEHGSNVKVYSFQGQLVYVFDPGTCGADMASEVINSNCESLGYLGGISGNTSINGENFSNATLIETVWGQ